MLSRLDGWQEKIVSLAGKATLLKSVAMTLPIYVMSVLKLPDKLITKMVAAMVRFWWGGSLGRNKIHWMAWSKLTETKFSGGLGFRDLKCFNLALLAKQAWRFLTNPTSFVAITLKAKYYPNGSLMEAKIGSSPSWFWHSIIEGQQILKAGARWRIGSGQLIRIRDDPWLCKPYTFKPCSVAEMEGIELVSDLINSHSHSWDTATVRDMFSKEDARLILSIPLPCTPSSDKLIWHFMQDGDYTVKSGYESALRLYRNGLLGKRGMGESSTREDKKHIWKDLWTAPVQGKLQHFVWKCLHDIAPVKEKLYRKKIVQDEICPVCLKEKESVLHMVARCKFAKQVWRISPLREDTDLIEGNSMELWWTILQERWKNCSEVMTLTAIAIFLIWRIWKCHNDIQFRGSRADPMHICNLAISDVYAYLYVNANSVIRSSNGIQEAAQNESQW